MSHYTVTRKATEQWGFTEADINRKGNISSATTVLRPIFRDHPGEPMPEENFWTLWCKGRLTEADTPTIQLGATPSGPTSVHLHHPSQSHFLQAGCPSCHPTNSVKALKATSTFGLGRRHYSSPQRCYLHRLRTSKGNISNEWKIVYIKCTGITHALLTTYLSKQQNLTTSPLMQSKPRIILKIS